MAATSSLLDTLPSVDPATGKVLQSFERTSPLAIPQLLAKARVAQQGWAKRPVAERCAQVAVLKTKILEARDLLTDAVVRDKASGIFFDRSKMHLLEHRGPQFKVKPAPDFYAEVKMLLGESAVA